MSLCNLNIDLSDIDRTLQLAEILGYRRIHSDDPVQESFKSVMKYGSKILWGEPYELPNSEEVLGSRYYSWSFDTWSPLTDPIDAFSMLLELTNNTDITWSILTRFFDNGYYVTIDSKEIGEKKGVGDSLSIAEAISQAILSWSQS